VGLPLSAMMLPLAWLTLTRWVFKVDFVTSAEGLSALKSMKQEMGNITVPEIRVAIVFVLMASTWILRPMLVKIPALAALDDSLIAIAGAILLFLLPSGEKSDPLLLRWKYAEQLPWGVLLLFGGGLTLAGAVSRTGLAAWIGGGLHEVGTLPLVVIVIVAATLIIFLTELTSNIATTATFLDLPSGCRRCGDRGGLRPNHTGCAGDARRKLCVHVARCDTAERHCVRVRNVDYSAHGASRPGVKSYWYRAGIGRRLQAGADVPELMRRLDR